MHRMRRAAFVALIITSFAASLAVARPAVISGPVHVVEADTLAVGSIRVRLKGVDAMERGTPEGDSASAAMRAFCPEGSTGDVHLDRRENSQARGWVLRPQRRP